VTIGSSSILRAVEQPISPSIQPVHVAATDPAFVPGITPPPADESDGPEAAAAPDETRDETPEAASGDAAVAEEADAEPDAEAASEDSEDSEAPDDAEAPDKASDDSSDGSDDSDGSDAEDASEAPDSDDPVLEASDRRGSVVADRDGVRFQLDDQEAEFDWDEIGAVEYDVSRFGRWLTVTVHLTGPRRRWYQADVEAPARGRLKEWTAQLDAVLDAYFEDA
jgi:hypothetical protein